MMREFGRPGVEEEVRNVHEGQMLERGLEDVSVQCTEQERERTGQSCETPRGI